jgi:hypothetical protein
LLLLGGATGKNLHAALSVSVKYNRPSGRTQFDGGRAPLTPTPRTSARTILAYVVFIYWVFRGKVREGEGYH